MTRTKKSFPALKAAASVAALTASSAFAQDVRTGTIDTSLAAGVDFRSTAFEVCLDTPRCTVGDLTIVAERQTVDGGWDVAPIYWDPIDGLGVMGGRQNDEIDADERLIVTLDRPMDVSGVWLSDLFIGEGQRYQGKPYSSDDVETADIELFLRDTSMDIVSVNGVFELPQDSFESTFTDIFLEGGDLLNRIIVEDASVSILMPDEFNEASVVVPLGQIDPAKAALFDQNAITSLDIGTLLGNAEEVAVFRSGSKNASRILEIRGDIGRLEQLRDQAEIQRRIGDTENGELGWYAAESYVTDRIVFTSGFQTSNDYSIAGLMIEGPFDNGSYMAALEH